MQILNRNLIKKSSNLPIKVMQFGGGNFLRAFVDWMIEILNEETNFNGGVAIIKPTERGNYNLLRDQDGLFTVVLDGVVDGKPISENKLISCVQKIVNPYQEWEPYLDLAKNETIRFIVSNTTEAGIQFNKDDKFNDNPPKEFPAKLTIWLYHRYQYFKGKPSKGCVFLPCELIENNGTILKETILKYIELWNLEADFVNWILTDNYFCNTLVDRIVSGYPKERADEIHKALGYIDAMLVAGEHYHNWVIEGPEEVKQELPFKNTGLNVQFVDDLQPYREMKVKILNGAHTAMVPVGYLNGLQLVSDVMNDQSVCNYIENLLLKEVVKTLPFPDEVKHTFVTNVLDRYRNPTLKHKLLSISLNGTSKFVTRLLPTLKEYTAAEGQLPKRIVFALSALICFYKGEYKGRKIDVNDAPEILNFFSDAWKKYDSNDWKLSEMIIHILSNKKIWEEDLNKIPELTEMVTSCVQDIISKEINIILDAL